MIARKVSWQIMKEALEIVNEKYFKNITYRNIEPINEALTSFRFTLRAVDCHKAGGCFSPSTGRRVGLAACWHVHGDFFDALFSLTPDARVKSCRAVITKDAGNWQDYNMGSMMQPFAASACCDCGSLFRDTPKMGILIIQKKGAA